MDEHDLKEATDNYELTWFGILFTDDSVTVKRLFYWGDYLEARESDFVHHVTSPFLADGRGEAMRIAEIKVKEFFDI